LPELALYPDPAVVQLDDGFRDGKPQAGPFRGGVADALKLLEDTLTGQPEYIVTYGQWGEFKLALGRIIRRGRRNAVVNSKFDLHTLDGGNPLIVKVLRSGAEIRAKSDATLAGVLTKLEQPEPELSVFDRITLASESGIARSDHPEGDDLVEYDCDGWVLERL
jgi:hypothetical protein